MKVEIKKTVEVSDIQRVQIADLADEAESKRIATRDEIRDFIWAQGNCWEASLARNWGIAFITP